MNNPMALNSKTYILTNVTTTSQQVTLNDTDISTSSIIIDNTLGTTPVFITSGVNSTTAVYPTSATVGSEGAIIGAGMKETYRKDTTHKYIAAIRSSGSGDVAIKVGTGE